MPVTCRFIGTLVLCCTLWWPSGAVHAQSSPDPIASHTSGNERAFVSDTSYWIATAAILTAGAASLVTGAALLLLDEGCAERYEGICVETGRRTPTLRAVAVTTLGVGTGLVLSGLYLALFAPRGSDDSRDTAQSHDPYLVPRLFVSPQFVEAQWNLAF